MKPGPSHKEATEGKT